MKIKKKRLMSKLGALMLSLCLLVGLMPVTVFAAEPTVTPGDVYRTTRTEAVVEFTSDTAGEYYYAAILPSEFTQDLEIDTTGEGVPCAAGEKVSVTVGNLTTDLYLLFLVVKGEDGTESEVTLINIPEWDWWTLDENGILHIEADKGLANWKNWLKTQNTLYQMLYKESVVGVNIWKDVNCVIDGRDFPANEYPNLAAYTVEDGNTSYCAEDGVLYNASKVWLKAYPGGKSNTDFTVPDAVNSISYKAFYGNTKLKNVTANTVIIVSQAFAESAIETFSANSITRIADWAFYNCKKLTTVTVNGGESFYIDMYAFENCTSLTSFPFNKISDSGFRVFRGCSSLTEIQAPNRVNDNMFANCTGLTKITVPDTVTFIGNQAFDGCSNLVSVTFESATPPTIFSSAFKPTQPAFRIHVPEGSEEAYIAALGEDFAGYILDSGTLFYPLFVNGERFRSDKLTVACGDGTAAFDPATNTLTLTNATITEYGGKYGYCGAINSGFENLTIVLVGDNTINTEGDSINTGMGCNLVITGDGTLTTNKQMDLGRDSGYGGNNDTGDLVIDGATVNVGTYLFVHHNITFKNGATVDVAEKITANHQSTVTVDGDTTSVTGKALSLGNGSNSDQTESKLVMNNGTLTLMDGVAYYDDPKCAIYFDPMEQGVIAINGGTFQTKSDCKVTNILEENIEIDNSVELKSGSWENGNLIVSEHTGILVLESAATCTKEGVKSHYKCADCGQLFEDEDCTVLIKDQSSLVIPKLEHTADKDWTKTDDEHYKRCTVCGEIIDKAAHSSTGANAATCKKKAVCDVCGAEYGEYADHSWTAATCTAPKTCSVCGITEGEALGHTESTQWSYDADNHWHGCTAGCGFVYEDSKAAHSFKWVIDKDATETESGYKHEECESCGYKKAAVVIPAAATPAQSDKADTKTENSNTQTNKPNNVKSPQTGNESGVYMWVLVLFVSIFSAYSAAAVYKKRYKIKK